jgi:hypothetical protein
MYHVDTNSHTELVPEDVCGALDAGDALTPYETVANLAALEPFLEGSRIQGVARKEGWYACLSAPGYLDRTDCYGCQLARQDDEERPLTIEYQREWSKEDLGR